MFVRQVTMFVLVLPLVTRGADLPMGHGDFVPTPQRPVGFRGDGSGHFPGATPPLTFTEKDGRNVLWSIKMPSWGQSSPLVVGKRIVTAAEPDTTLCVDADTGKVLWQDALGVFPKLELDPASDKESGKYVFMWTGHGYTWPCSDGQYVVKVWNGGRRGSSVAAVVCYDVASGKRLWLIEFSGDLQKHKFTRDGSRWAWRKPDGAGATMQHADWSPSGYASPQLYGDMVIYHAKGAQPALVALDKKTGDLRWVSKPNVFGQCGSDANFLIMRVGPRDVLVTNIGTVLDPRSGEALGEAIPSIEKDGRRISRLWGPMDPAARGEVKIPGISPITAPGAQGVVAFGPDWPFGASEADAERAASSSGGGAGYCYLAVRLGFDAQGKLTTACLFNEPAVVPRFEYGNGHMTIVGRELLVMPGYGSSLASISLENGKLLMPPQQLWKARKDLKPDPTAPEIVARLQEFGLNIGAVTEFNRGIGRNGYSSYSRTFVDGRGYLWYMNRQGQFYRIDPRKGYSAELAGTLAHPECWTTTSSPMPHGNRIYVRTFGRLTCVEDPKAAAGKVKADALRGKFAASGAEAIPALVEAIGDEHEDVRWAAVELLGRRPEALGPLTKAMEDANTQRRWFAARALAGLGAGAAPAAATLARTMAGDAERDVRIESGRALKAIANTEGIAADVVRAAGDASFEVRHLAASLLARIGPDGAAAVPALMKQLRQDMAPLQRELKTIEAQPIRDSRLRHSLRDQPALQAMSRMGAAATPPAIELLSSGDEVAMRWACTILAGVGPEAKSALPALEKAAAHVSPEIKAAVEGARRVIDVRGSGNEK
jgi:HEAT repeat protein